MPQSVLTAAIEIWNLVFVSQLFLPSVDADRRIIEYQLCMIILILDYIWSLVFVGVLKPREFCRLRDPV